NLSPIVLLDAASARRCDELHVRTGTRDTNGGGSGTAGGPPVPFRDGARRLLGGVGGHEGDGAATGAGARQPRSEHAAGLDGDLHDGVQFGPTDLVVVAQAGV